MNNLLSCFTLPKNANDLKKLKQRINLSTISLVLGIFLSTFSVFFILHKNYTSNRLSLDQHEIQSILETYQSNLLSKFSIVASSPTFMDYLRSEPKTQNKIFPDFLTEISKLRSDSIAGMELIDAQNRIIYNDGEHTTHYIKLNLCYFDQTLDAKLGECSYQWLLYFNIDSIYKSLFHSSNKLKSCKNCEPYPLFNHSQNNQISIAAYSGMFLNLKYINSKEYYYYFYFLITGISIFILGFWSWLRLNHLFNNYIVNPIKKLTTALKHDIPLNEENNIDEIQLLIDEISAWRKKYFTAKDLEQKATLAKISAQLAHDIRSPVAAMRIVLDVLPNLADPHKRILYSSLENIDNITNNFLNQYKNCDNTGKNLPILNTALSPLLQSIVLEKSMQHKNSNAEINLEIPENFTHITASINPTEFKRLISNLINNAVEAMTQPGSIKLELDIFGQFVRLTLSDTGKGIPAYLLDKIAQGGVSIGKEKGHGLGLSHAKKMIELWQGNFEIQSVEGIGTTISIMIPIAA